MVILDSCLLFWATLYYSSSHDNFWQLFRPIQKGYSLLTLMLLT